MHTSMVRVRELHVWGEIVLTHTGFQNSWYLTDVKNERNLIENKETYLPCHGYLDRSVCTCRIIFLTPFYSFYAWR